jgi:hypothetical protein
MSPTIPDLAKFSAAEKDSRIPADAAQLREAPERIAGFEKRLAALLSSPKTPDNSSIPPSKGEKPKRPDTSKPKSPRNGSLRREGGGRTLCDNPNEVVPADGLRLDALYSPFKLSNVRRVVCRGCDATTLAPVPEGLKRDPPFSPNTMAVAISLRVVHAISYQRLSRLFLGRFGLAVSEGALEAGFSRHKPRVDAEINAILSRLCEAIMARPHRSLVASTRREYRRRLESDLDAVGTGARDKRFQTIRQGPKPPVCLPRPPRDFSRQHQERAGNSSHRQLPLGHRRLSFQLGRWLPCGIRSVIGTAKCRNAAAAMHFKLSWRRSGARRCPTGGLSSYDPD